MPSAPEPDFDRTIELHMPLAILVVGVLIQAVAAIIRAQGTAGWAGAMQAFFFDVIIQTSLMLVGMAIAARFRGIELGHFWLAVLKLSAVVIGPAALATLLSPLTAMLPFGLPVVGLSFPLASLVVLVIEFVLYFALLGALFSLDESDTWYCICVIFVLRVALYFAMPLIGI